MKVKTQLAMIPVMVRDQNEALHFYTEKLGLEKRTDITFGPGMRWLTVAPEGQKKPEIALARPDVSLHGEERVNELMERASKNVPWVLHIDNCHKAYETLLARGVKFVSAPTAHLDGVEAIFKDPDGNSFALVELPFYVGARLIAPMERGDGENASEPQTDAPPCTAPIVRTRRIFYTAEKSNPVAK